MTTEIMDLMEKRRENKNNVSEYKKLHKTIQKNIKVAKESYLNDQCREIELLEKKFDYFHMHKKIREMTGSNKSAGNAIRDIDGHIITDVNDKLKRWKAYKRSRKPKVERNNVPTSKNTKNGNRMCLEIYEIWKGSWS
jgi:hypothetical protein